MDATSKILGLPKTTKELIQSTTTTETMIPVESPLKTNPMPEPLIIPHLSQAILNATSSPTSINPSLETKQPLTAANIEKPKSPVPSVDHPMETNIIVQTPFESDIPPTAPSVQIPIETTDVNPSELEVEMNQKETDGIASEPQLERPPTPIVDVSPELEMQEQEQIQEEEPIYHLAKEKSKKKKMAKEKKEKEKASKEKKKEKRQGEEQEEKEANRDFGKTYRGK
ncbi:hypothetical protein L6452_05928 [Arctium lappa]|uniref:Uncharacterized protein n=1 Tax=Arctium lappa TaxID=4217 RepID=A0ACB9EIF9_ARCLA|nr:hypothetical protein L6452_05928 [Arctium lappa]